jgi:ribonuclease-3
MQNHYSSQERFGFTPLYKILSSWGPDHEKTFKVGVYIDKDLWGEGEGKSKQKAEQDAAIKALEKIHTLK